MTDPDNSVPEQPQDSPSRLFSEDRRQKRELLAEQRASWKAGDPLSVEDVLSRWPGDPRQDIDTIMVIVEDYHQRQEKGENPSLDDYHARFPEHAQSITSIVSQQELLNQQKGDDFSPSKMLRLPDAGDELFGFRLRGRLGQGAFARVFLAEQADLAGRPVVLKVSAIGGNEAQTLAQLQHTHIVPIYSMHEDASVGLRAVCMPYFGGASLSDILQALFAIHPRPEKGKQFVELLGNPPASDEPREASQTIPLEILNKLDYVHATVWLIARLAEGLQHAHDRGILHRDVKPSNVLIADDGQPLLLDFNLAQNTREDALTATLGGTVAYMAPEHLRALSNRKTAKLGQVDHRSDIYSLGMVLFEMLTGRRPFDQSGSYSVFPAMIEAMATERSQSTPSLRAWRKDVPWGLESIARKCLAPDPEQRYQKAEDLAEDLRRFLSDQPLRFAPERSLAERARKWTRRHPRLTTAGLVGGVAFILLGLVGAGLSIARSRLGDVQSRLSVAEVRERKQAFEAGTVRALCLVNTNLDYQDNLRQGITVCEQTLGLFGLLEGGSESWHRLDPDEQRQLGEDARELMLLLAGARVQLAPGNDRLVRDALALLERAEALPGLRPSKALYQDRARYLELIGERDKALVLQELADETPAESARDYYLLAASHARKGGEKEYTRAITALDRAIALNPRHYWSWVQRGLCRLEQKDHVQAAFDLGAAVGLWPELAWGHFNYAYALCQAGRPLDAIHSYSQALQRDPELIPAYVNRGLTYLELRRFAEALADFEQAINLGKADAILYTGQGIALEGLGKSIEADRAFTRAFADDSLTPREWVRVRWSYGFAVSARLPAQARRAFTEVIRREPTNPQALYGLAMLAMAQGNTQEARVYFDRAIKSNPTFLEARRYRAIVLARLAKFELAQTDVNWCLERDPRGGPTLYAAACVAALAADKLKNAQLAEQAIHLLEGAAQRGHSLEKAGSDPDLAALRKYSRFQRLTGVSRETTRAEVDERRRPARMKWSAEQGYTVCARELRVA